MVIYIFIFLFPALDCSVREIHTNSNGFVGVIISYLYITKSYFNKLLNVSVSLGVQIDGAELFVSLKLRGIPHLTSLFGDPKKVGAVIFVQFGAQYQLVSAP